jgi:hypothetical protein
MQQLESNVTTVDHALIRVEVHNVIEALLSLLEHWKTQEQLFVAKHAHTRDLAEIGHLTENLISVKQLQEILSQIRSPLSVTFAYRNFRVRLLNLTESTFAYMVKIPVLEHEVFQPYRLWTIPFIRNNEIMKVEPEASAITIGRQTGHVINAGKCHFKGPMVCPNTIRKEMPCAEGIAVRNPNLLAKCGIARKNVTLPIVVQMTETQVLLTTLGESIEERCLDGTSSNPMGPGTYLLTMRPGCTIDSDSGWSYNVESDDSIYRSIEDKFLLTGLKVNFTYPSFPTTSPLNWTHFGDLHEFSYHNLPDLRRIIKVRPVTIRDGHVAWISLALVLILCGIVVSILVYQRYITKWLKARKPDSAGLIHSGLDNPGLDNSDLEMHITELGVLDPELCKQAPEHVSLSLQSSFEPKSRVPSKSPGYPEPSPIEPLPQRCSTGVQFGSNSADNIQVS